MPRWEKRINEAKLKHRTALKLPQWQRYSFVDSSLCKDSLNTIDCEIPRVHCSQLSLDDFVVKYEKACEPVCIQGLTQDWKATENWTMEALGERFRNYMFKCGEDDNGRRLKVKFKHFNRYTQYQKDDSPMYIFDDKFEDDRNGKALLADYQVPEYFKDDLFDHLSSSRRPPHRWFLIGPARSGTTVHIDPLGTSAWNTVVSGHKRWVLFHPSVSGALAKGKLHKERGEDGEPATYFHHILPRLRKEVPAHLMFELIQGPGDTLFVPGGWWHAVINVDNTVACTQNYASPHTFERIWLKCRKGRKKMSARLLGILKEQRPHLYQEAVELGTTEPDDRDEQPDSKRMKH